MKHIVVPLDGSPLAEHALPYVRLLAPALHLPVTLLRVLDGSGQAQEYPDDVLRMLAQQADVYMHGQAQQLRSAGITVNSVVRNGSAPSRIADIADADPSLIAMTTHGYTGVRRMVLGSVTDAVVRTSSAPVLVVRSTTALPESLAIRRILVPLDGSDEAQQALPYALELAQATGASLLLLRAVELPTNAYAGLPTMTFDHLPYDAMLSALREDAAQYLAACAEHAPLRNVPIQSKVIEGHATETIVSAAVQFQVDLVVMATHGRGGLGRMALGSVADRVLHMINTPLVLVRVTV